jgi:RNA recognition motif-containing protein
MTARIINFTAWKMMLLQTAFCFVGYTIGTAGAYQSAAFFRRSMPVSVSVLPKEGFTFVPSRSYSTTLFYDDRDSDYMESFVGGMRYEMVELPDSLVETACFIGNLDEFVNDDMLSLLFSQVSTLNHIPASVARKPNASSLKYGFAIFPTVEEKEAAIIRFHGYLLNDRALRVESIIDYKYRVRVPEKLVTYTVGSAKRTRGGGNNTMRRVQADASRFADQSKKNERKDRRKSRTRMSMSGDTNTSSSDSRTKTSGSNGKWKKKDRRRRRRDQPELYF